MRLRRRSLAVLFVLLALGLGLYLARDQPRRWAERTLSRQLDARVRIGRLSLDRRLDVHLRDVRADRIAALPGLDGLRAGEISTRLQPRAWRGSRIGTLRIDGLDVVAVAPCSDLAPARRGAGEATVERIEITGGNFSWAGDETADPIAFEARVDRLGTQEARLELHFDGRGVDLLELATLAGDSSWLCDVDSAERPGLRLEGFGGNVRAGLAEEIIELDLDASLLTGRWAGRELSAEAPHFELDLELGPSWAGEGRFVTDDLRLDAPAPVRTRAEVELHAERGGDGRPELTIRPQLGAWGAGRFLVQLPWEESPLEIEGRLEGIELARLAPLAPRDLGIAAARGEIDLQVEGAVGDLGYRAEARVESLPLRLEQTTLDLAGASVLHEGRLGASWRPGAVRAAATLQAVGDDLAARIPDGALPAGLEIRGLLGSDPELRFEGSLRATTPDLGEALLDGTLAASHSDLSGAWGPARIADLARRLGRPLPDGVTGSITAQLAFAGPADRLARRVEIDLADLVWLAADGEPLWQGAATATLELPGDRSGLAARARAEGGLAPPSGGALLPTTASATASYDPQRQAWRIERVEAELADLARASGDGSWLEEHGSGTLVVEASSPDSWAQALGGGPQLLSGYDSQLEATAELAWSADTRGVASAEGELRLEGGTASEDGARVVAGVRTERSLRVDRDAEGVRLSSTGPIGGFEILVGELYADYAEREMSSEISLVARPEPESWSWQADARLSLADGATRIDARLDGRDAALRDYRLQVAVEDVGSSLRQAFQEPFQGSIPALADLRAAGLLRLDVRGRLDGERQTVGGRLVVEGAALTGPEGRHRIEGLDAEVPFQLAFEQGQLATSSLEQGLPGELSFREVSLDGLDIEPTRAALTMVDDTVYFGREIRLPLLQGAVSLESLTLHSLTSPERSLSAALRFRDLSLRELSTALAWPALEGEMNGYFPEIRLDSSRLLTRGVGVVDVFGGQLRFENIAGEDVLSRFPRLRFSASFDEIDLAQLTQTVDFGSMTGTLRGWVRDVELFRDVPLGFSARLETVQRKGVKQRIGVRAIDNLARVSGGAGVGIFDRGVYRFFRSYPYERFAVQVLMSQDRFLLRGLEQRGDRELILRGRGWRRLDVVNARPGRTVFFQTLVRRLGNLDVEIGAPEQKSP